jgi:quinol monooxygenase YgiN
MGRFVIVAYRPKPGQDHALSALVEKHVAILRSEHLVTDREPYVMLASDGTLVEVFEWRSAEAIAAAHASPAVQALWGEFGAACDYVPLSALGEAQQMFAEFDPLR